ncbi:MAG: hypothetical protein NVS9B15_19950 [Acidobacteriaceae bacterium]
MGSTSGTTSVALAKTPAREALALSGFLLLAAALATLVFAWRFAEIDVRVLFRPATFYALRTFLSGLYPPVLSPGFLRTAVSAALQTLATAVTATLLSIVFAIPLAVLATATLWSRGTLVSAEQGSVRQRLFAIASRMARGLLGFMRAVPDLVWALLFVAAVGLGPLAGTLALTITYCGVLGRVYADVFENANPQLLESLHSTGASRLQVFLLGIWPQALPHVVAYSLYSFECSVRAAAVMGFVGAGGIGYEIGVSMKLFEYGQVLTLLLLLVALLAATDAASRSIRRSYIANPNDRVHKAGAHERIPFARALQSTIFKYVASVSAVLLVAASFWSAGLSFGALSSSGIAGRLLNFVGHMLPPDFSWAFLREAGWALLPTSAIALLGTLLGLVIAVVLAIPATSTLALQPNGGPGKTSVTERVLRRLAFWGARLILNVLRAIPELIWVLICILAVGIGPFAGTIALGLHTAGVLGKLYAETMEEVPARPLEALKALGARPLQVLLWAIWPQARPLLSSYTVLRWEMNLRASTILGLVGGGGIGQAIYNNVQLGFYSRLSTLILLVYGLVLASDWIGERVRMRVA